MAIIVFIGLGKMGGPMAINLLKAGHDVFVQDLIPDAVDLLVAKGAKSVCSIKACVEDADFIISMLPASRHVEDLYLGDEGLLQIIGSDTVVIDSSTIDADSARKVAVVAGGRNVAMLDAPVSGGVAAAEEGTLAFMCGGDVEIFSMSKSVLGDMGRNIFYAGDHGAGQVAKACNNMLLAIHMIGSSEALRLGVDNGIDPAVLSEIMLASSGRNWSLEVYNPYPGVMGTAPASNNYQPGFMVDLMVKDLCLAMDCAIGSGSSTPLGLMAHSLFAAHAAKGNGKRDFSSIFEILEQHSLPTE